MILTKEEAACFIYGLEISEDNKAHALSLLQKAGLEPVWLANGDPTVAVAVGEKKIRLEPWKYKKFVSEQQSNEEEKKEDEESECSSDSFEVNVPRSRRAIMDLAKLMMLPNPIDSITEEVFMTEEDIYDLLSSYTNEDTFTMDQLSDWLGKDGFLGTKKRKIINGIRKRGRSVHLVKAEYRNFTWKDISNIQEFRKLVRASAPNIVTVGYARKSKTNESKEAIEKSINLQVHKLKTKLLCKHVFVSCNSNAD